jgi:fructose-1,6-bisphosphatase/inositol monophosphatase family enzyme
LRVAATEFLALVGPAMRQAASIARALEGRVQNRPKSGESSDVKAALTIADSAAQEAILVPLLERFPTLALRAEEDTPSVAGFASEGDEVVVVDPIDGTLRSYLEARGPYAVMAGLARAGRYEAALVALPREGLFFEAARGGPAWLARARGEPREVRSRTQGGRVLVSYDLPEDVLRRLGERGLEASYGCGGAIALAPLLPGVRAGLRVGLTAEGISIRGRIGALIAHCAGARLGCEGGREFPEEIDEPARALLVAASEEDLEILRYALGDAV